MAAKAPTKRTPVRALIKQEKALRMFIAGGDYQLIADTVGYASRASAYTAVRTAIARHNTEMADLATEAGVLAQKRLDALWQIAYPKAARGDMPAVGTCLAIHDRMVRLQGVEAPQRVEATVTVRADIASDIELLVGSMTGDPTVVHEMPLAIDGPS